MPFEDSTGGVGDAVKHVAGGNCWEGITSPQDEDVCLRHEQPRGECSDCPPCSPCAKTFGNGAGRAPPEPPRVRLIEPTMSKTDDLLSCQWPYGKPYPDQEEVSEAARFGSAFHEVVAGALRSPKATFATLFDYEALAKRYDVDEELVKDRVLTALPFLIRWLTGDNPWKINFAKHKLITEKSVALHVFREEARICDPPDPVTHVYPDRRPGEFVGTADLFVVPDEDTLLVLDHKSGYDVGEPEVSGQLKSLALTIATLHGLRCKGTKIILAYLHAPRENIPTVYAGTIDVDELTAHAKALRTAYRRIGKGFLRPSGHCSYCPAYMLCPTQHSNLVALKRGAMGAPLTAERVGFIHEALAEYHRLDERLKSEMKRWIEQNGPGVRPDGQLVDLIEKPWTNLSQASIKRALGEVEAARVIKMLEKKGCIEHTTRKEMRAVPNERSQ